MCCKIQTVKRYTVLGIKSRRKLTAEQMSSLIVLSDAKFNFEVTN